MSVGAASLIRMIINCDTCTMRDIACGDCVVMSLLAPVVEFAPDVSAETMQALQLLSSRDLLPPLHYKRAAQGS